MAGKRKKKYNKLKHIELLSDQILRGLVVCYVGRLKGCVFVDKKKNHVVRPTELIVAAASRPHQWSCYIAVFGKTETEEYMKSQSIFSPSKYYQADLAPIFEQHHHDLVDTMPKKHQVGVGWIADPYGEDISEADAGRIFEMLEAWKVEQSDNHESN